MRLLLVEEASDDLVDVGDSRCLLDLLEGILIRADLRMLLVDQCMHLHHLHLHAVLARRLGGLRLRHLLLLLGAIHLARLLLLLLQHHPSLHQLLLSCLALVEHDRFELAQLHLGSLLGGVGVVRHDE